MPTFSGGGGATQHGHGALLELTGNTSRGNQQTLICDTTVFDTDGYYNAASGVFTIPAGLGGLYYVVCYWEAFAGGLTGVELKVLTVAASANVVFPSETHLNTADGNGSTLMQLAVGDTFSFSVLDYGADPVTMVGGQTGYGLCLFGS